MTLCLCVCVNLEYVHASGKLTLTNPLKGFCGFPSYWWTQTDLQNYVSCTSWGTCQLLNVSVLCRVLRRSSTNICKNCRHTILWDTQDNTLWKKASAVLRTTVTEKVSDIDYVLHTCSVVEHLFVTAKVNVNNGIKIIKCYLLYYSSCYYG